MANGILKQYPANTLFSSPLLSLQNAQYRYILLKFETWHFKDSNPLTQDWETIDNEGAGTAKDNEAERHRNHFRRAIRNRQLKPQPEPFCDEFRFEYALDDGDIVSMTHDEFEAIRHQMERVVEIVPIVKQPDTWGEERDVQLAIRITGCGRRKVFSLTHVYWA